MMNRSNLYLCCAFIIFHFWLILLLPVKYVFAEENNLVPSRRCIRQWLIDTYGWSNNNNNNTNNKLFPIGNQSTTNNKDGDDRQDVLHQLHKYTSCESFSNRNNVTKKPKVVAQRNDDETDQPSFHVVILLSDYHNNHQSEQMINLAAGLLVVNEFNVTIIQFQDTTIPRVRHNNNNNNNNNDNDNDKVGLDTIRMEILSRVPVQDIERYDQALITHNMEYNLLEDDHHPKTTRKNNTNFNWKHCMRRRRSDQPLEDCAIETASTIYYILDQMFVFPRTLSQSTTDCTSNNKTMNILIKDPDILIMDTNFLGGLLFAENRLIPTVAFGTHNTLDLAVKHSAQWTPSSSSSSSEETLPYRMYDILKQRMYSLSLTVVFLKVNRVRKEMGLESLKSPIDCLRPIVSLLVEVSTISHTIPTTVTREKQSANHFFTNHDFETIDGWKSANNNPEKESTVHFVQPILPPCIPCLEQPVSMNDDDNNNNNKKHIIMVLPPRNVSAKWTHALIRGLSLTIQSLQEYDECAWDPLSCRKEDIDFQVIWLMSQDQEGNHDNFFPPVVPSFIVIRKFSGSLLDSVALHPNTIVALTHCNSDSYAVAALGVGILCISQSKRTPKFFPAGFGDSVSGLEHKTMMVQQHTIAESSESLNPKELAAQLLFLIRQKTLGLTNSMTTGQASSPGFAMFGLEQAIEIVRATALTHRENKPWKDLSHMHKVTTMAANRALRALNVKDDEMVAAPTKIRQARRSTDHDFDVDQPYDAFTVFIAWIVLLSALTYMSMKDSVLVSRWRPKRTQHRGDSISDGIFARLPDLDNAWKALQTWYTEQPALVVTESFSNEAKEPGSKIGLGQNLVTQTQNTNHHRSYQQSHNPHGHVRRRRKMKTARQ